MKPPKAPENTNDSNNNGLKTSSVSMDPVTKVPPAIPSATLVTSSTSTITSTSSAGASLESSSVSTPLNTHTTSVAASTSTEGTDTQTAQQTTRHLRFPSISSSPALTSIWSQVDCLYPDDLVPFTRKPLFLVIDSQNSSAFLVRDSVP